MTDRHRGETTESAPGRPRTGDATGAGRASRHRSEAETAGRTGDLGAREMFACPHCGHQLSMFREARFSPGDRAAARVAGIAGSWPFLLILVLAVVAWFVVNTILPLFQPHPSAMLDYLGTALAIIAALQGPLILLTQRRESDRDRARDIETFHISQNTEADLHAISQALSAALEQWGQDRSSAGSPAPAGDRESDDPGQRQSAPSTGSA